MMTKQHIVYPHDSRTVIDVTKPPYNVDKTGQIDCTQTLIRIIDDVLRSELTGMQEVFEKLESDPDPNAMIGFESRKINGKLHVIFPEKLPEQKIIYFPKGTYLISDTVSYTFERFRNTKDFELNRCIRLIGETRDGVILKLQDNCPGFENGASRAVVSFMRGTSSNIAMSNYFENITIHVGKGNPGAIGLIFFANNTGAVRNVTIQSGDPEGRGDTGLAILHELAGVLVKDVEVIGFNYGIRVEALRNYTVFEQITLKHQCDAGFAVKNTITSIRGLKSENSVPALITTGPLAHVVLVDGELLGGSIDHSAISLAFGTFFARNVHTAGYINALTYYNRVEVNEDDIDEYSSHSPSSLFEAQPKTSLDLSIEDVPDIAWETDLSKWVSVNEFGAKGDGVTDDTEAIQKAMQSGSPIIYFQSGKYLINAPIHVPETVERVNFMFIDLIAGSDLREMRETGTFVVTGNSESPLVIEDLFAWEAYYGFQHLVDHASTRTLILRDLHVQTGALYRNSVSGGKVFIENVCTTIGSLTEDKMPYGNVPCFEFTGQKVWARQLNPERSLREVVNNGSSLWVLGFKTEGYGSAFVTTNQGSTEVLGGVISIGGNRDIPAIVNEESSVSVVASTNGYFHDEFFPITVRETRDEVVRELHSSDFPTRFVTQYTIPLYAGHK